MRLDRITRRDVRGYVDDLTKAGRGAPTAARLLSLVSAILSLAVEEEHLALNPASRVKPPATERKALEVWDPADVVRFLKIAGEHRLGPIYEVMLHTALRRGEVCGLRWQDVDLDEGTARSRAPGSSSTRPGGREGHQDRLILGRTQTFHRGGAGAPGLEAATGHGAAGVGRGLGRHRLHRDDGERRTG